MSDSPRLRFRTPETYQEYFYNWVEEERRQEMERHLQEIAHMSGERRQEKGRAILGLSGKDAGRGLGGTYVVRLTGENGLPKTDISVGDLVLVSKGKPSGKEPQATVIAKSRQSLTVAYLQAPPRYVFGKRLRADLFANDIVFQRMETALKVVPQREEWIELLLGLQAPAFDDPTGIDIAFYNEQLNASQQEAVRKALAARQAFMLHGPPGTGKTTTLVELIRQEVERASFILAATDSNVAVDNLVEKLARAGLKVLRMGHPARVNENLIEYALDHVIMDHPSFMQAQQYYREIDRMKEDQQEYDRPTGQNRRGLTDKQILDAAKKRQSPRGIPADKLQSMARWLRLQRRINDYFDQAKALTQEATVDLLADTQVVCATHATAGSEVLRDGLFYANRRVDLVVVDEASQAMEPTSLISLVYGRRFVMAGDDRQLPPTVLSDRARPVLQLTLFERLRQCYDPGISHMLRIQYRMHEAIMAFSNERFYGGKLAAHPSVKRHTLAGLLPQGGTPEVPLGETLEQAVAPEHPVVFLDTETMDEPWEQQRPGAFSRENLAEVALVSELFAALQVMGLETHQVGIISPYDHQVDRLKGRLGGDERLEIKTVDGFQGREKEAIVLSLVRANETGEIGFLKDLRRLNVAVTRARRKLIIIGHGPTLRQHEAYDALLGRALSLSGRAIRTGAAVG